jgi:eukaryotic-like serine/threonine-protein kinase
MMPRIGQYQVKELLGEGGVGRVHAAFDTVLEREVAIKSLRPELLNDRSFVERFRAEATHLARLNHPNITTVHALLAEGGNFYMVMERVRGQSLEERLRTRAPFAPKESLAIFAQAAEGLAYAHSMGVIHRDIKPANLMMTDAGLVKIMDFGIARARGSQRLTRDGSIVGTLAYMAPEQLRGEPGDERSDLYGLAIVLYEMLAGHAPFAAPTDYALMQAQIHARPPRLTVPDLATSVEAGLLRALAKKPEQRFGSMQAFSDALGASALRREASRIVRADLPTLRSPQRGLADVAALLLAPINRLRLMPVLMRVALMAVAAAVAAGAVGLGALALLAPQSTSLMLPVPPKGPPIVPTATRPGGLPPTIIPPPQMSHPQPAVLEREQHVR